MPDALVCFVAGFFGANVGFTIAIATGADTDSLFTTGAGLVGLWVGLLASMAAVSARKGSGSLASDFGLRFQAPRDALAILGGAAFQVTVVPLLYLPFTRLITDLDERLEAPARELTDRAGRGAGVFVLAALVIIGAPIVEELYYRGLVLRSVERRFGSRVAIGASSVVFAAAHFEPLQFPALLALGLLLAWLTVRFDRLGPSIFVHAGFNAVTMAVLIASR